MDSSHQSILDLAAQRGLIRPRDLNERGLPTVGPSCDHPVEFEPYDWGSLYLAY